MNTRRRTRGVDADVAVVGGGVVGATLAGALAALTDLHVVVIERRPCDAQPMEGFDPRTLAVTPASARVLDAIGAWRRLTPGRAGTFSRIEVWDAGGGGRIELDAADIGAPALGTVVENRVLAQALEASVGEGRRIAWERPAVLSALAAEPEAMRIELEDGRSLRARLVVAADGARSRARSLAGLEYLGAPYRQEAVICVVETEHAHAETARQVFLPDGPLAFLPLAGRHICAIVWSTTPAHAAALCEMPVEQFQAELAAAFDLALGRVLRAGPRARHPLARGRAPRYVAPRVALVGDAAHAVHPLAGQGANLGIMDAAALAECVADAVQAGRDPASWRALRRYERWRKGENLLMQCALDGLRWLFAAADPRVQRLRSAGLSVVHRITPVKATIMRRACGLAGDLPALARFDVPPAAARGTHA